MRVPSRSNRKVRSGGMRGNVARRSPIARGGRAFYADRNNSGRTLHATDRARGPHGRDHLYPAPRRRGAARRDQADGGGGSLAHLAPDVGRVERPGRTAPGQLPAASMTTDTPLREARLKPEYAELYPGVEAGVWYTAA